MREQKSYENIQKVIFVLTSKFLMVDTKIKTGRGSKSLSKSQNTLHLHPYWEFK